jgi:hypothetical protein
VEVQVLSFAHLMGQLAQLVERFVYTEDVVGSSPALPTFDVIIKLSRSSSVVERRTENPCVGSSILPFGTSENFRRLELGP